VAEASVTCRWRAVKLFQSLSRQYVFDSYFGAAFAVVQQVSPIRRTQSMIEVVCGKQHAMTRGGKRADFTHHFTLVAEIYRLCLFGTSAPYRESSL
jgi:hypothetical protein